MGFVNGFSSIFLFCLNCIQSAVRCDPRSLWVAVVKQEKEIENIMRKGNEWTMPVTASRLNALFVSDWSSFCV